MSFRVRTERKYRASPSEIFAAWTEPALMTRWFHMAEPWSTPLAEVDLRLGGAYRVDMFTGGGQLLTYRGTYREIDPPIGSCSAGHRWRGRTSCRPSPLNSSSGRTTAHSYA